MTMLTPPRATQRSPRLVSGSEGKDAAAAGEGSLRRSDAIVIGCLLMLTIAGVPGYVHSDALADGTWLAALYNATNGTGWTFSCRAGWDLANPGSVCNGLWSKVQCSSGVVSKISLSGCNLHGPLPELPTLLAGHIGTSLQYCTFLDLSFNSINSTLPSTFGSLSALIVLDVNSNQLKGTLPSTYGIMSRLFGLDVSSNQLTGTLPSTYGFMSGLQILYLYNNSLTGPLPSTYGNMFALQQLQLHINSLTGTLPSTFGSLSSLKSLTLSSNSLNGTLPSSFGNMSALQILYLHINSLTGTLPSTFGSLSSLKSLTLSSNSLNGTLPSSFGNMSALQILYLHNNSLTGTLPSTYGNMFSLQQLQLHINSLTGTLPSTYGFMSALEILDLHNNSLTGTLPSTYGNMFSLQQLQLHINSLTGTLPSTYGFMSALQVLSLDNNSLTGTLPSTFGRLSSLTLLMLSSNSLNGTLPSSFGSMSALRGLDVSSNRLTGTLPSTYGFMSVLQVLYLYNNSLTGTLPSSWYVMQPDFKSPTASYDLSFNQISGDIPLSWLWSNATIGGSYFIGNCLTVKNLTAVNATGRFYNVADAVGLRAVGGCSLATKSISVTEESGHERVSMTIPPVSVSVSASVSASVPMSVSVSVSASVPVSMPVSVSASVPVSVSASVPVSVSASVPVSVSASVPVAASVLCSTSETPQASVQLSVSRSEAKYVVPPGINSEKITPPFPTATQSFAVLASVGTASSAAFVVQRGALVLRLLACEIQLDAPADMLTSPTQMQIGSTVQRYQRGTVMGNICVVVLSSLGAMSAVLSVIPTCASSWCASAAVAFAQVQVYLAFADLCLTVGVALWSGRVKRFVLSLVEPNSCEPVVAMEGTPQTSAPSACAAGGTHPAISPTQHHPLVYSLDPVHLTRLEELIERICYKREVNKMWHYNMDTSKWSNR